MTVRQVQTTSLAATTWLSIAISCWAQVENDRLRPCPPLAETYFVKSPQQRAAEFTTRDFDTQFTIYICGMQYMHPPTLDLAVAFASQGERTANYLRERLMRPVDDRTTEDIVRIFAFMEVDRTYDVARDTSLMRLLTDRVDGMKDAEVRENAQILLARVLGR